MDLWDGIDLTQPGVVACTGAGGKTSVLMSLAKCAEQRNLPVLVTSTTKMFVNQVRQYNPVFAASFEQGHRAVERELIKRNTAAWFCEQKDNKVIGILPEWLDQLTDLQHSAYVLVEADGAAGCLIKAPASHEPVVPQSTQVTIGVLNLQAIGQRLSLVTTHRLPLVLGLLDKQAGDPINWSDLAVLANHPHGIFQYSQGRKILLLAGAEADFVGFGRQIAAFLQLNGTDISCCMLTCGYGTQMRPLEVVDLC